jgi:cytidylate kinase
VGRCADYVLRDREGMLSVFITADWEDRIARIVEKRGMSPREAEKFIYQGERRRASYYNYYTFKEWGDSASYDLCLNSSRFGIKGCVDIIISMLGK